MGYGNNKISRCRSCGRQIIWIRTRAGRNMPCDTTLINYSLDGNGTDNIVTPSGTVLRCNAQGISPEKADGAGYISHFATCPNAANHRRR